MHMPLYQAIHKIQGVLLSIQQNTATADVKLKAQKGRDRRARF